MLYIRKGMVKLGCLLLHGLSAVLCALLTSSSWKSRSPSEGGRKAGACIYHFLPWPVPRRTHLFPGEINNAEPPLSDSLSSFSLSLVQSKWGAQPLCDVPRSNT